jgi:hypothetical protein
MSVTTAVNGAFPAGDGQGSYGIVIASIDSGIDSCALQMAKQKGSQVLGWCPSSANLIGIMKGQQREGAIRFRVVGSLD